jgi:hypothetical protein
MFNRLLHRPRSWLRCWVVGSEECPPYLLLLFLVVVYFSGVIIRVMTSR